MTSELLLRLCLWQQYEESYYILLKTCIARIIQSHST